MGFKVPYITISDQAQDVGNGKLNILGIFEQVYLKELPTIFPAFTVVVMLVAEGEDDLGEHRVVVRLMRPTGQAIGELATPVRFAPTPNGWLLGSVRLLMVMGGVPFREHGRHWVVVLVDDVEVARHPVFAAPLPTAPAPSPTTRRGPKP